MGKCGDDGRKEEVAVEEAAGFVEERGGWLIDLGEGGTRKVEVEAEAQDVAIRPLERDHLGEDASDLLTVDEKVVRPADGGRNGVGGEGLLDDFGQKLDEKGLVEVLAEEDEGSGDLAFGRLPGFVILPAGGCLVIRDNKSKRFLVKSGKMTLGPVVS